MISVLCPSGEALRVNLAEYQTVQALLAGLCSCTGLEQTKCSLTAAAERLKPADEVLAVLTDGDIVELKVEVVAVLPAACEVCRQAIAESRPLAPGQCGHATCEDCTQSM